MRTVYVAPEIARDQLRDCCAINVSPLLRELILRAAVAPLLYDRDGPDGRVMQMILDEISVSRMVPLHLPTPSHPHLAKICAKILGDLQTSHTLEQLARAEGMSKRTAERVFLHETAMTFTRDAFPRVIVAQSTLDATARFMQSEQPTGPARRLLVEGQDRMERAIRARAADTTEA